MSRMHVVAQVSGATGAHRGMSKQTGSGTEGHCEGRSFPKTNEGVHGQSSLETGEVNEIEQKTPGERQGRQMKECQRRDLAGAAAAVLQKERANFKTARSGTERTTQTESIQRTQGDPTGSGRDHEGPRGKLKMRTRRAG